MSNAPGFDDDALALNREGRLAPGQAAWLASRRRRTTLVFAAVVAIALATLAVALFFPIGKTRRRPPTDRELLPLVLLVGGPVAFAFVFAIVIPGQRLGADLAAGRVATVHGPVTRRFRSRQGDLFYVHVGGVALTGSARAFWTHVAGDGPVRIHYLPRSRTIVSIERG